MNKFWSEGLRTLKPYVPGEQPKEGSVIKLNTNENPYPPSPRAIAAIKEAADAGLRLYPDPDASAMKAAIARHYGVKAENVFAGNGSDEVLAVAFLAFFRNKLPLAFPDITYSFYPVYCELFGVPFKTFPITGDWQVDLARAPAENGGVLFPNPNAPTGCFTPVAQIDALLRRNTDTVVLVDEAYIDFGGQSAIPLVQKYPNLLVTQTFSKSRSLAGLRAGFAVGHAELITGMEAVKNSFNSYTMDRLAIAGAAAAMDDKEYFEKTRTAIIKTREETVTTLQKLGFEVLPSKANFVFAHHPHRGGQELYDALRAKNILVRYWNTPRLSDFLRITIGTDEEMAALAAALHAILR